MWIKRRFSLEEEGEAPVSVNSDRRWVGSVNRLSQTPIASEQAARERASTEGGEMEEVREGGSIGRRRPMVVKEEGGRVGRKEG
jgi:hypothetical protein